MGMTRAQKQDEIKFLNEKLTESRLIVLAHNEGLTVKQMTELRAQLRENGAGFKVVKNSLATLAAKGTNYEGITDLFKGPVGMAYSEDAVAAAKVTQKFAKDNKKFVIIGGGLGTQVLDAAGVEALSKLPSLDELRGKLVGLIQAPATKIAGVLQAPAGQLARVMGAYANKG
jgi:large subunit ribosomal protein L10